MNEHDDIEARLRAALANRADAVEPAPGTEATTVERMLAARQSAGRRRVFLSAAAVVAVLAAVAGALVVAGGDDDDDTEVATGGETTTTDGSTTTTAPEISTSTEPYLWPLASMSIRYDEADDAALAFGTAYLGLDPLCVGESDLDDGILFLIPSPEGCSVASDRPDPRSVFTEVAVERRAQGWVVVSAESNQFAVTTPTTGATVGAAIAVAVEGLDPGATTVARVPAFGQAPAGYPAVDTGTIPVDADGTWRLTLGAADGPAVLIVSDGATATARPFFVDSTAFPPPTTTTTIGETDDGVQGWPGTTSRHFDGPEAAAQAFVEELLDFDDPTLSGQVIEGADAEFRYTPRPTASVETTIVVHDTGTSRGWVVTGLRSNSGVIDSVSRNGDDVAVTGSASAFEATVNVRLLDLAGNVLGETITMAGGSGVLEPFAAVVHQDVASTGPVVVQIAEHDASAEGTYVWAAWALVPG